MTSPAPQVRTMTGVVRGMTTRGVFAFHGIPYAQPPVGDLRFAAPMSVLPWKGVRDASQFGPPPPQSSLAGAAPVVSSSVSNPDEWLTVNIWSPSLRENTLSVMVWFYGGAYMFGLKRCQWRRKKESQKHHFRLYLNFLRKNAYGY